MRSLRLLLIAIAFFICIHTVAAVPQYQLVRRQDESEPTTTASTVDESSRPSTTSRPSETSATRSASDQESTSSRTSTVISSATSTSTTTTATPSATSNGTGSSTVASDSLPLHPKITPALGIIGALFMISGTVLAVVGIKNNWIYVFGSAAYLTALAVTVLIIYLMNPPISNAVQGAFFVAAFFTGVLFGGLALIFSDLTEGLGCLLGGYCLSMWFLCLKEGGLISSTGGRAIFIGCLSVAGYCLSFSHYTRTYGLIGSISFSGATIAMLGVDCFSRAGLKEFWLYLWDLNRDVFPLNTDTFPVTKGIKVELAGVVILCIFGIISQLRLWRVIKERRDKREEHRRQAAEEQHRDEAELGRKVEDRFQKERVQWEAAYGNKNAEASSVESGVTTPQSPSIYEKPLPPNMYGIVAQVSKSENRRSASKRAMVHEDEIELVDAAGAPIAQTDLPGRPSYLSRVNSARASSEIVAPGRLSRSISTTSSLKVSAPPPPVVVPLPFRIPQEDDAKSQSSDNASVSAMPDTEEEKASLNRQSLIVKPTMKRASTARSSTDGFQAEDVVIMSKIEDDRASSIAATLDEEDNFSLQKLSPPTSPFETTFDSDGETTKESKKEGGSSDAPAEAGQKGEVLSARASAFLDDLTMAFDGPQSKAGSLDQSKDSPVASPTQSGPRQSLTVSTDLKHGDSPSNRDSKLSVRPRRDTVVNGGSDKSQTSTSDAPSPTSQGKKAESVMEEISNTFPTRLSKVAQSYRTNEWAKHLETADKPELDEIAEPSSPGTHIEHERPAPVSEGIDQPFAVNKHASRRISSDSEAYRKNALMQINTNSARQSQIELRTLYSVSRRSSQQTLNQNPRFSQSQVSIVEPLSQRSSSGPIQLPSKTLMGQRESLMRNRVSTQNFNNQHAASTPNLVSPNEDDMTLAQRRRVLKHAKPPSSSQKWQKNAWAVPQTQGFDSHQPKRTVGSGSEQKREELLAGWRESMQQGGMAPASAEEQQRAAMMNAKRMKEMEMQQHALLAQQREEMRMSRMRSSEMLDAHREAMRRMQAAANRNAG